MQNLSVHCKGLSPLLLHNGQTKDPLNPYAKQIKAISSKRNKSDEDVLKMREIEWFAGLYTNENGEIIMPGINIERAIVDASKANKLGKKFSAAFSVLDDAPIIYQGAKNPSELFNDPNFVFVCDVKIQKNSVMRTRPRFNKWELKFTCMFNDQILNTEDVVTAINVAGQLIGFGDWRPRFGRFIAEIKEA